jgi:hypothetical protein
MGELLRRRHRLKSVPDDRQLHRCAVAPVVAHQAQNQATQEWPEIAELSRPLGDYLRFKAPMPRKFSSNPTLSRM